MSDENGRTGMSHNTIIPKAAKAGLDFEFLPLDRRKKGNDGTICCKVVGCDKRAQWKYVGLCCGHFTELHSSSDSRSAKRKAPPESLSHLWLTLVTTHYPSSTSILRFGNQCLRYLCLHVHFAVHPTAGFLDQDQPSSTSSIQFCNK